MGKRLLNETLMRRNGRCPPVWLMRQAGRYHAHYQKMKEKNTFVELCKSPELACEVTMGPIEDFDFDAAILFSDILFPLEAMGVPLDYAPGPQLGFLLKSLEDCQRLVPGRVDDLSFQSDAIKLIRQRLPDEKALIGFVGAPWTLFCFAVEGSHRHGLEDAKAGIDDGRWEVFLDRLLDLLVGNMVLQARAGVDAMALFDTCAGDLDPKRYAEVVAPVLQTVMARFREQCPETNLIYYSKGTGPDHWRALVDMPFECLGVDWHHDLIDVIKNFGQTWAIQGNFSPELLRDLSKAALQEELSRYLGSMKELDPSLRQGWISGLGHGVLPETPEDNVRLFIDSVRKAFDV